MRRAMVADGAPQLRRVALLLAATAALVLAGAGVAMACTGRASLTGVDPPAGKAGRTVSLSGNSWDDGGPGDDGEVEIHWQRTAGEPLTTAQGPSFNVDVRIPSGAEDGTHYVVAVAYDKMTGEVEGRDSVPFKVTSEEPDESGDPSRSRSDDPSTESSSGSNPEGSSSSDGSQNSTSSSSMSASGSNGPSSEDSTSGSTSSSSPSRGATSEPSGARSSPGSAAASAPSEQPASQPSASPEASGSRERVGAGDEARSAQPSAQDRRAVGQQPTPQPQPQSSAQPAGQPLPSQAADQEPASPEVADPEPASSEAAESEVSDAEAEGGPRAGRADTDADADADARADTAHPSARSGSGDLWSGFSAGDGAVSLGSPGLDGPVGAAGAQSGGPAQGLALAAGLAGAGLLVLMAGSFAALSRRRALATSRTRGGA